MLDYKNLIRSQMENAIDFPLGLSKTQVLVASNPIL